MTTKDNTRKIEFLESVMQVKRAMRIYGVSVFVYQHEYDKNSAKQVIAWKSENDDNCVFDRHVGIEYDEATQPNSRGMTTKMRECLK